MKDTIKCNAGLQQLVVTYNPCFFFAYTPKTKPHQPKWVVLLEGACTAVFHGGIASQYMHVNDVTFVVVFPK